MSCLAPCPTLYTEWFWAGAFAAAVNSVYLNGDNRAEWQDVVAAAAAEFAHLIAGVGISGERLGLGNSGCGCSCCLAAADNGTSMMSRGCSACLTPFYPLAPQATPLGSCCCS